MDERRDPPPPSGSSRPVAVSTELPTPLRTWERFVNHFTECAACRGVEVRCELGDGLYTAWKRRAEGALDELGGSGQNVTPG